MKRLCLFFALLFCSPFALAADCPEWLDHTLPKLHSNASVDLCEVIDNKPTLLVNTASYCGFTGQFGSLQKLHERFKDEGLVVIGFPSNSFNQEDSDEEKTASVCYKNFGVEFTMVAPVNVRGGNAHPIFKHLAENSRAPSWNFNKYLVSADGNDITHFSSTVAPGGKKMTKAIASTLSGS